MNKENQFSSRSKAAKIQPWAYSVFGCSAVVVLWQLASMTSGKLLIASPFDALKSLIKLSATLDFYQSIALTLGRQGAAVIIGGFIGIAIGVPAGMSSRIRMTIEPFRWCFMAVPPAVIVVLLMFYIGTGSGMIVIFSSAVLWPVMYINVLEGVKSVDEDLLEVAKAYSLKTNIRIKRLYLPAIGSSCMAGMTQIIAGSFRVIILGEIFGAERGIGASITRAGRQLEISEMFAWILIPVALIVSYEFLVLRPAQKKIFAWRKTS